MFHGSRPEKGYQGQRLRVVDVVVTVLVIVIVLVGVVVVVIVVVREVVDVAVRVLVVVLVLVLEVGVHLRGAGLFSAHAEVVELVPLEAAGRPAGDRCDAKEVAV